MVIEVGFKQDNSVYWLQGIKEVESCCKEPVKVNHRCVVSLQVPLVVSKDPLDYIRLITLSLLHGSW